MDIITSPFQSFPLAAAFFKPLLDLSVPPHLSLPCHGIEDSEWLLIGGCWKYPRFDSSDLRCDSRILGLDASGRAFLDAHHCPLTRTPARSSFFDALASPAVSSISSPSTKPSPAS